MEVPTTSALNGDDREVDTLIGDFDVLPLSSTKSSSVTTQTNCKLIKLQIAHIDKLFNFSHILIYMYLFVFSLL
jgi:hypothetical protein